MPKLRPANPLLEGLEPYDPRYLPAQAMLSANENPSDVPAPVREAIQAAVEALPLNRYPDPLANKLRDALAAAYGLQRGNVLVGNGGDELLFDLTLAWGGQGRTMLSMPPTFSVYAANAHLTGTRLVEVARRDDFTIDEPAVLKRVSQGDIDLIIVCTPNNPTGDAASISFIEQLLDTTDALVLVDEAYGEFAGESVLPLLADHDNLVILHTFSKAYCLAGVRLGFVLASPKVINELCKVRQPYSVDAVSQAIACQVCAMRSAFEPGIQAIVAERERLFSALSQLPDVEVWPSSANYLFFRVPSQLAQGLWQACYDEGVLIRDFGSKRRTENCIRTTVGTKELNDILLTKMAEVIRGC